MRQQVNVKINLRNNNKETEKRNAYLSPRGIRERLKQQRSRNTTRDIFPFPVNHTCLLPKEQEIVSVMPCLLGSRSRTCCIGQWNKSSSSQLPYYTEVIDMDLDDVSTNMRTIQHHQPLGTMRSTYCGYNSIVFHRNIKLS